MIKFEFLNFFDQSRGTFDRSKERKSEIFLSVFTCKSTKTMCNYIMHFLKLKTFLLKHLVGERYKGWISRPPLSVYSSVIKHLALAYMPCSLRRVFNSWYYRLNFLMIDEVCFYIENDHASVELLGDSH